MISGVGALRVSGRVDGRGIGIGEERSQLEGGRRDVEKTVSGCLAEDTARVRVHARAPLNSSFSPVVGQKVVGMSQQVLSLAASRII